MGEYAKGSAPQPMRSMEQFNVLVGEWTTVGMHPLIPSAIQGHASFEWLKDGALLVWYSHWDSASQVPSAYSIVGHDDAAEACSMLYTDVRGVARIYQMTLAEGVWKQWRDSADFAQRMTATISDDRNTIVARGELSRDGGSRWEPDMTVTFTRKR